MQPHSPPGELAINLLRTTRYFEIVFFLANFDRTKTTWNSLRDSAISAPSAVDSDLSSSAYLSVLCGLLLIFSLLRFFPVSPCLSGGFWFACGSATL
jgi:hypothetical protein